MFKRPVLLVAALLAIGATGVAAQAGTTTASTAHAVQLYGKGGGIGNQSAGLGKGHGNFAATFGSKGALIENQYSAAPDFTPFSGTITVWAPTGSYSGKITSGTLTGAGQQGPPTAAHEKIQITGGTGAYTGATGSLTITHAYIAGSAGFYNVSVKGTITYG